MVRKKSLLSLLAPAFVAGALSSSVSAQYFDLVEINVSDSNGPAPHKLVELDVDNDSLYDLFEFTDVNGQARFSNVVSVEDSDRDGLMDSWELEHFGSVGRYGSLDDPDRDGRSNLREYQLGSNPTLADIVNSHMRLAMGPIKGNVNFATPKVDFFANAGENVSLGVYDLRGRLITQTSGVGDLSLSLPSDVADGKYFALLRSENDMAVASFITMGAVQSLSASRLSLDEAVSQGMVADKSVDKDESQLMNIRISGEGYNTEVHQENVVPGVNVFSYMLTPSGVMNTIFGDAWNLVGDEALRGGTVFVRNASGEVFSAPVDSSFSLDYSVASPSEQIKVWFEHPLMSRSGVLIDQDGLAVRDRIAQVTPATMDVDTMSVAADNAYLTGAVRYKAVDTQWVEDANWQGLLYGTHVTRGEDRPDEDGAWRLEGWLNQYDVSAASFGAPISTQDINDISFLINYKKNLLTGAQPDGTVYANVTALMTSSPAGGTDVGYLFIDPTAGPNSFPSTIDGYLERWFGSTPPGGAISDKAEELFNEELRDVNGTLSIAIYNDGTLEPVGLAAFNAHYLFDDGSVFSISKK